MAKVNLPKTKGVFNAQKKLFWTGLEKDATIYRTKDNKEMVEWEKVIKSSNSLENPGIRFRFWSNQLNSLVVAIGQDYENIVFDTNNGKIIGKFRGLTIGRNAEGTLIIINPMKPDGSWYDTSKVEFIDLKELTAKYQNRK